VSDITPSKEFTVLQAYVCENLVPSGLVRAYRLRPLDWDGHGHHAYVLATTSGTVIQGPLVCGLDGHGVMSGQPFDWFVSDLTPDEVLAAFCQKTWQSEVAEQDLIRMGKEDVRLADLVRWVNTGMLGQEELARSLKDLGYAWSTAEGVGYGYPFYDAPWIVAIQQVMKHHIRFPN